MKRIGGGVILLVLLAIGAWAGEEPHKPALPDFIKGYTWGWVGYRGQYEGPRRYGLDEEAG